MQTLGHNGSQSYTFQTPEAGKPILKVCTSLSLAPAPSPAVRWCSPYLELVCATLSCSLLGYCKMVVVPAHRNPLMGGVPMSRSNECSVQWPLPPGLAQGGLYLQPRSSSWVTFPRPYSSRQHVTMLVTSCSIHIYSIVCRRLFHFTHIDPVKQSMCIYYYIWR